MSGILHKTPAVLEIKKLLKGIGKKISKSTIVARMSPGIYSVGDDLWVDIMEWTYGDLIDNGDFVSEIKETDEVEIVDDNSTKAVIKEIISNDGFMLRRKIWSDVPDELKIDEDNIGSRVWVAGVERTSNMILARIRAVGDIGFPKGGVELRNVGEDRVEPYYLDTVVLHPKNFSAMETRNLFDETVVGTLNDKKVIPIVSNTGKSAIAKKSAGDGKVGRKGKDVEVDVRKWMETAAVKKMKFENAQEFAAAAAKGQKKYWWMCRPNHQIHTLAPGLLKEFKKGKK